jgi:serine/threonine protein kinase
VHLYGAIVEPKIGMVMELCRETLFHVMTETKGEINWEKIIRWSKEMVLALKAIHENDPQILHRDQSLGIVSPHFLSCSKLSFDGVLKLADFGLR